MSLTRRIDQARKAFAERNLDAASRAHTKKAIAQAREEHGGTGSQYIGDMVYGGLDGIVTTFAVVSGVAGAALGPGVLLTLGLANLLADGVSMGAGAYLSLKSEREYYDRERERELWEVKNFPEGELEELRDVYRAHGYSAEDAETLVMIHSKEPDRWVDEMMVRELGMMPDERRPLDSGIATFLAFLVAGSVPLLIYVLDFVINIDPGIRFPIAIALSAAALFALGAAKVFVTERSWFRSGLEMLIIGSVAASVAYAVGYFLQGIAP
jgi:VIT1/CCC1 family predicted Fe2+/Mn2+ transporter